MELAREEAFGPLAGYSIVATEEEAVTLANSSDYGLAASIFTKNLRKGFAIAKKLQSGYVSETLGEECEDKANVRNVGQCISTV